MECAIKISQIIIKIYSFMILLDWSLSSVQCTNIFNYCKLYWWARNMQFTVFHLKLCHLGQHTMWIFMISHLYQQCICPLLKTILCRLKFHSSIFNLLFHSYGDMTATSIPLVHHMGGLWTVGEVYIQWLIKKSTSTVLQLSAHI